MRIVLVDPPGVRRGLNTGYGYLCAALKKEGHIVEVIDFANRPGEAKKRMQQARGSDLIGFSIKSSTLNKTLQLARMTHGERLIAGGPHIALDGKRFMEENPQFDLCVMGEGEEAVVSIARGDDYRAIDGTLFRDNSRVTGTGCRRWIENLDDLPFPEYSCFDSVREKRTIQNYPIVTSRGCPYRCTFCSVPQVTGRRWRARSPENVVAELLQAKDRYGSREFKVLDDNFTLDVARAKDICRLLLGKRTDMTWSCANGIRADRVDEELLGLMRASGCESISIGIESADPAVLSQTRKGEELEHIRRTVELARKKGIRVQGFFIIGLTGSTYESDKRSLEFAKAVGLDEASWGLLVPYPGTELWDQFRSDRSVRFLRDWKEGFHLGANPKPVFETRDYPAWKKLKAYYLFNLRTRRRKQAPKAIGRIVKNLLVGK
ncbi:MAG: radical SAM protein [Acidobacteriota bacterium]